MRNVFNRLLLIVLSFVSFAFGIVVLLLYAGWITPGMVSPNGKIMYQQWNFFAQMRTQDPLLVILVGAICAGVGLLIFLLEIWPARRQVQQPLAYQVR